MVIQLWRLVLELDLQFAIFLPNDALHRALVIDFYPAALQLNSEFIGKSLEATRECAQTRAARMQARPHPSHVNLFGIALAKLAYHHWLPHRFIDLVSGFSAHPGVGGGFFQLTPVIRQAQVKPHKPKTDFIDAPAQAGVHYRRWNGIEWVKLALVIHNADGFRENYLV